MLLEKFPKLINLERVISHAELNDIEEVNSEE